MKRLAIIGVLLSLLTSFGCDVVVYDDYCYHPHRDYPPPVPTNVHSVTGDNRVYLYWNPCGACRYRIYRGYNETGYYYLVGETSSSYFVDFSAENGETYYYAISSVSCCGAESELSYDIVFDTPRPEGFAILWDADSYPDDSGYDFSEYSLVPRDYPSADIYFNYDGRYWLSAANSMTDILIYGQIYSFDDIDYAPENGYIPGATVEIYPGWGYVIWTCDNHFAKLWITEATPEYVQFEWAYQTDTGNPELRERMNEKIKQLNKEDKDEVL
ncbi:MAG: hypothetical protein B6D65_00125 [candidate division Zixibacteria bacterium 4484_93]|nr:MAG: hypothetical protein B6D65_00125 [candidate division Zixibacteria bacterium 4484_93]